MMKQSLWPTRPRRWGKNDWDALLVQLAALIRECSNRQGRFVIVAQDSPHRFVQFATIGRGMRAEAISNEFLERSFMLTGAAVNQLRRLGWKDPSKTSPNFHCHRPRREEPAALALLAVRTLRDVFKVPAPGGLTLERGSFGQAIAEGHDDEDLELHPSRVVPGTRLRNVPLGYEYEVGRLLGAGGFGTAYIARQVAGRPRQKGRLCLKITETPEAWHCEAYFGQLLGGVAGAIAVHDSFAALQPAPGVPTTP